MADAVKKKRGGQLRPDDKVRKHTRAQDYNDGELKTIGQAADAVGLPFAAFVRMSALQNAKRISG